MYVLIKTRLLIDADLPGGRGWVFGEPWVRAERSGWVEGGPSVQAARVLMAGLVTGRAGREAARAAAGSLKAGRLDLGSNGVEDDGAENWVAY